MNDTGHCSFFFRFCYKFKGKICEVNTVQLHCLSLHVLPWTILFTFFLVRSKFKEKKILNPIDFMIQVHPTSFIVDDIVYFFFCLRKNIFFFFCFYVLKLILILFLFIFRLISLLSFMLFRKPIWNDDFFNYLFNLYMSLDFSNFYF